MLISEAAWEAACLLAQALTEYVPVDRVVSAPRLPRVAGGGGYPGDDYNARATESDVAGVLEAAGWKHLRGPYWKRPGKDGVGPSATLRWYDTEAGRKLYFYVFSTNAEPFEAESGYDAFGVYARLEHNGDFAAATRALGQAGYGEQFAPSPRASLERPAGVAGGADPAAPLVETWTHDQLMAETFGDQPFIVDKLVSDESLTILGGVQKGGKTWMGIQLAQAVASGEPFLGRKTVQGEVIYLALEDGARRLQKRLQKQNSPSSLPITWVTKFPKLDSPEGIKLFNDLAAKKPRVLILDTLAAAKSGRTDEQASGPMADLFNCLREIAQRYKISIVIVHHHGKSTSGDPAHDLRGSSAIGAAADVLLGLYRVTRTADGEIAGHKSGMADPENEGNPDFYLKARGRDIEDETVAVRFGINTDWLWSPVEGNTHDKRVILQHIKEDEYVDFIREAGSATVKEVAEEFDVSVVVAATRLKSLVEAGRLVVGSERNEETRRLSTVYRISGD